jgi:hypothetical protein
VEEQTLLQCFSKFANRAAAMMVAMVAMIAVVGLAEVLNCLYRHRLLGLFQKQHRQTVVINDQEKQ